jgi:hypothetical protein
MVSRQISVTWEELRYPDSLNAAVRDVWCHNDLGSARARMGAMAPGHAVVMLTIQP